MRCSFDNDDLLEKANKCERILAAHGRKLLLDIDIRREFEGFAGKYPGVHTYMTRFVEIMLDDEGEGTIELPNITRSALKAKISSAWTWMMKAG